LRRSATSAAALQRTAYLNAESMAKYHRILRPSSLNSNTSPGWIETTILLALRGDL
jgi:hypothetical protein